jgi:Tetratricopeptide repeat
MKRPILPLLLKGTRFFTLANLQYENVTTASMPTAAFVARLRALLPAPPGEASDGDDPGELARRHDHARQVGRAGDRAEAVRLFRDVIADRTRVLGPDHPDTLTSRHQLARNVGESGDRAEAVRLYRDLVADTTRILGPDHRGTLVSELNLHHYGG